ncbi:MAG: hypothetical protein IPI73_26245 [Betaproteobacteria bacterium]|nr:hypothetical protein [Betaproteobacteria bacterium]
MLPFLVAIVAMVYTTSVTSGAMAKDSMDVDLAGFDLRQVENVVDQRQRCFAARSTRQRLQTGRSASGRRRPHAASRSRR